MKLIIKDNWWKQIIKQLLILADAIANWLFSEMNNSFKGKCLTTADTFLPFSGLAWIALFNEVLKALLSQHVHSDHLVYFGLAINAEIKDDTLGAVVKGFMSKRYLNKICPCSVYWKVAWVQQKISRSIKKFQNKLHPFSSFKIQVLVVIKAFNFRLKQFPERFIYWNMGLFLL